MQLAEDELHKPTNDELLKCIVNIDQVNTMLRLPGRRYIGEEGPDLAATKNSSWMETLYLPHQLLELQEIYAGGGGDPNWMETVARVFH